MTHHTASALPITVLIVTAEGNDESAAGRQVQALADTLRASEMDIVIAASGADARATIGADASLHAVIVDWDLGAGEDHAEAAETLTAIRARNVKVPVFLLAERTRLSEIPVSAIQQADDFIWLMEDTIDFIAGRIQAAIRRYQDQMLPPMFRALVGFSEIHEYSWHTPGHTGGTAFLKSPVGRVFSAFFGENLLRSDLSVSVGELGSLLDHSGPIGDGEAYAAQIFGADRTYYVTNGTSTSNRVVVMASVTRGQIALCDRNCHKSIEHSMTLTGAVPVYLMPSRNHLGIIGPVHAERLQPEAIQATISANPLTHNLSDATPALAILTNSTYDGLCYSVAQVEPALAASVNRILFDEAWYAYAKFHPIYQGRFGMHKRPDHVAGPTVFATQSTHKLLAALSQASMIHVKEGKHPISHERFNEAFMLHASTSPQYAIIASNDVSAAMMDGPAGTALINESIVEAIAFRQMIARLQAEFAAKGDWFFGVWQPDTIFNSTAGTTPFFSADPKRLATDAACWELVPNAQWHGFGDIGAGYCMLDPIKVSIVTVGEASRERGGFSIPAGLLSAYLDEQGIVPEKSTDFTVLFLFSLGITKGKWGTLINALLDFKREFDANTPLKQILPRLVSENRGRYERLGLRDLAEEMADQMRQLKTSTWLEQAFGVLPKPVCTPVRAYEQLVLGHVEKFALDELAGRTIATGIVPYPPGIPLLMPGEAVGRNDGPALRYLGALEAFDRQFPGFTHDIHGVEVKDGRYYALCLTNLVL
ncbi:MAG: arginine decarboxylase [Acidocella sp. 20-57-95]|nr:MAG: arginine decarboxylase [Acidocella sp. 20-57-95]OYV58572.1 MAG: arginine decarboxylase [Acidocella sp. 21-58-7]HQT64048.1 Orn/Lys/Arg decarboxylase N-terminal domain-containing protein [Acidocella sp.]